MFNKLNLTNTQDWCYIYRVLTTRINYYLLHIPMDMIKYVNKISHFKTELTRKINLFPVDFTTMPKNYNKAKAMLHMKKIQLFALLAQDLEYSGISDLSRKLNVSTEQLYKDFEKHYGQKYTTGLNRYEVLLRRKSQSNLLNQTEKTEEDQ